MPTRMLILIISVLPVFTVGQVWNLKSTVTTYLSNSFNTTFGRSIAIDGQIAVVGDPNFSLTFPTIKYSVGAVYVFKRDTLGQWNIVQRIGASDGHENAFFGRSVAIKGNTLIVGAYGNRYDSQGNNYQNLAGAVYEFKKNSAGTWVQSQKIVASNRSSSDKFGISLAMNQSTLAIGADEEGSTGAVYILERNTAGSWVETQIIHSFPPDPSELFGHAVDISETDLVVGAYNRGVYNTSPPPAWSPGSAFVFRKNASGTWTQFVELTSTMPQSYAAFGETVSISDSTIVVGANRDGTDENNLNSISNAGAAYIFELKALNQWFFTKKVVSPARQVNAFFGYTIDVSTDRVVLGDPARTNGFGVNHGGAYILKKDSLNLWGLEQTIGGVPTMTRGQVGIGACIEKSYLGIGFISSGGSIDFFEACFASDTALPAYPQVVCTGDSIQLTFNGELYGADKWVLKQDSCGGQKISETRDSTLTFLPMVGIDYYLTLQSECFPNSYCKKLQLSVVDSVDNTVSRNGNIFKANQDGAKYRWLNCNASYNPILGQTNQSFTINTNGSYAVEITLGSCVDTSACELIYNVGIAESEFDPIIVSPNPCLNELVVTFSDSKRRDITIYNVLGNPIIQIHSSSMEVRIETTKLAQGMYLLATKSEGAISFSKFLKL